MKLLLQYVVFLAAAAGVMLTMVGCGEDTTGNIVTPQPTVHVDPQPTVYVDSNSFFTIVPCPVRFLI